MRITQHVRLVPFDFSAKLFVAAAQGLQDAGYRIAGIDDPRQMSGKSP